MSYHGHFTPRNPAKYKGDSTSIIYRSLWERQVFKWCDTTDEVEAWSSESVIVPYISQVDGKKHRYFVDLKIRFSSGKTILVEIKPFKQTIPPVKRKKVTKAYLAEVMTWGTNVSKWKAAETYALDRGMEFCIWTENELRKLGLVVYG